MEMFLVGICMSILGFGVAAAAFGLATREVQPAAEPEALPQPAPEPVPAKFFAASTPAQAFPAVPVSALLLEIENHVRLEQAAAESFLASPTIALLHSRTISPLIQ